MSKLYTENDLIDLVQSLKDYTHESHSILGHDERDAKEFVDIFLKDRTPIQLPTDEESAVIALKIADALKDKLTSSQEAFFLSGFQTYAKWMRDKIKGGQGE